MKKIINALYQLHLQNNDYPFGKIDKKVLDEE